LARDEQGLVGLAPAVGLDARLDERGLQLALEGADARLDLGRLELGPADRLVELRAPRGDLGLLRLERVAQLLGPDLEVARGLLPRRGLALRLVRALDGRRGLPARLVGLRAELRGPRLRPALALADLVGALLRLDRALGDEPLELRGPRVGARDRLARGGDLTLELAQARGPAPTSPSAASRPTRSAAAASSAASSRRRRSADSATAAS